MRFHWPFCLLFEGIERCFVVQAQATVESQAVSESFSKETLPIEIIQLLAVLARIEARRQAKLRAVRKEVG